MKCSICDKHLSRKTTRMVDGKTFCSKCMFASRCSKCGKPKGHRGYSGPECQCNQQPLKTFPSHSAGQTRKKLMGEDQEDWRADALAWVGRKVRIIEGPSTEGGAKEVGIIICVDATDYRPSAWVKINEGPGGRRPSYPSYRSCDLCWLEDVETDEGGQAWCSSPGSDGHGKLDGAVVADRIQCVAGQTRG